MELYKAQTLAAELITIFNPYTERIEIAGSVRRECKEVKDIDLVVIQHPWKLEKFFLTDADRNKMETKKHRPSLMWGERHKQIMFKGIKVEFWLCSKWNWGLIYLIRTGSAEFSQKMLARWKQVSKGGYSEKGYLHEADGTKLNTPEETDVFNLCKLKFIEPKARI